MKFIDPELSPSSQVIATFNVDDQVLSTESSADGIRFIALVNENTPHPGKHLGGTRIGLLSRITVDIQTLAENAKLQTISDGTMYAAQATYEKKDGEVLTQDFDCALYLNDQPPVLDRD